MRKAINGAAAAQLSQISSQELESDLTSSSSRCQLALPFNNVAFHLTNCTL